MVMRTVIGKSGEEKVVDLLKEIQRKEIGRASCMERV